MKKEWVWTVGLLRKGGLFCKFHSIALLFFPHLKILQVICPLPKERWSYLYCNSFIHSSFVMKGISFENALLLPSSCSDLVLKDSIGLLIANNWQESCEVKRNRGHTWGRWCSYHWHCCSLSLRIPVTSLVDSWAALLLLLKDSIQVGLPAPGQFLILG